MLAFIRSGLDQHDRTCPLPAKAIFLNPGNYELFGWDEVFGVPVLPDARVRPKRFVVDCDGSTFGLEDQLEEFVDSQTEIVQPLEVPSISNS